MLAYGTSDTSYVDKVSSIVTVDNITNNNTKETKDNDNSDKTISCDIANALGINYNEDEHKSLVLGNELTEYNIALISDESKDTLENKYSELNNISTANFSDYTLVNLSNTVTEKINTNDVTGLVAKKPIKSYSGPGDTYSVVKEYNTRASVRITTVTKNGYVLVDNNDFDEWILRDDLCSEEEYKKSLQGRAMFDIDNPDTSYNGGSIQLTAADRDILERLVMGEAGGEGYEGAALVAQCIRDAMLYKGYNSVESVRTGLAYTGSLSRQPNSDVKRAVAFIFDDGGYAVRHRIFYFYAFQWCNSPWHETQPFVIQHGGHRFFAST